MNYKGEREGGTWLPAGSVAQVMVGGGHTATQGIEKEPASEARSIPAGKTNVKVPMGH